jgi:hypothetical protein
MSKFQDVKVGDTVNRKMGGVVVMPLKVTAVDEKFVYCGPWQFERDTGYEYDPGMGWGSKFGVTGSFIEKAE